MDRHKPPENQLTPFEPLPMRGGMITVRERPALSFGEKSLVQNMRCWHPGFETRAGYTKLNTTAYNASSDSPLNIYQFVKGKVDEKHLFIQFGDDELVEASNDPPATGTTFGTSVFSGSSGQIPASFTNVIDYMLYSNGADQHRIYAGQNQQIDSFIVVKDSGAHPYFPDMGEDYSFEVIDADSSGVAILDDLADYVNDFDAIYIMTKTPIDLLNIVVSAANSTASVLMMDYWNGAWTNDDITDNTASGGAPFAVDGTIVFDTAAVSRTDEIPRYMFGQSGFWYKLYLDNGEDSLDAEVEISSVTYDCTGFVPIINVWNGIETDLVQGFLYVDADGVYYNYAATAVEIGDMTSSDYLYVASPYPLEAIYNDYGSTINTTAADPLWEYWNGSSWQTLTEKVDGTNETLGSGWYAWARPTDEQKLQFNNTPYYAYWYRFSVDATIDTDTVVSFLGMPYFDISDFGSIGRVCATWKRRALYTFNKFPRDIYVTESSEPLKLNGSDYAILQPGDGRDNATVAIIQFHNEIMVFQEEKGARGGCVTLFEGYSPATFGNLVLSTRIGTFSPKSVDIVDGSKSSTTKRDLETQTQAFFLSHYGVFMSDGRLVTGISDDIQNYFDPRFSECIRKGYEDEMWLSYDSTENVVKIGIVSGSSATTCNKFFVYDVADGVWYEDVYADSMSVFKEVEADSGQFHTLQIAAGSTTGIIYRMNNGTNDDGDAIEAKVVWELSHGPYFVEVEEILVRAKVQGAGTSYDWSFEEIDEEKDSGTKSMAARYGSQTMRRNRILSKTGSVPWITFSITADTLDVPIYIYDMSIKATATDNK